MTDTTDKTSDKTPDAKVETAKPKPHASSASKAAAKKPTPAGKAKPGAPAPQKSGGRGFMWVVIILLVVGGSMTAGWPYIGPYVGPQLRPIVEDVRARLGLAPQLGEAAQQEAQAPEAVPAPAPAPAPMVEMAPQAQATAPAINFAPAIQSLATRLDVLEGQLGAVSNSDGQAALAATGELVGTLSELKAQLAALKDRLAALEQAQASRIDPAMSMQALVLAATQLRARLMGNAAFTAELTALERIAADDDVVRAVVNRLRPHAEVGVPSEAALISRFAPVAVEIIRAGTVSGEQGWLGAVKDSLSGLVTVRRTDPSQITNAVERAVAEAEAALQLGDLPGAAQALSLLQGPPGDAAAAWLGDASARIDADAALEDLHTHALEALAQASGG